MSVRPSDGLLWAGTCLRLGWTRKRLRSASRPLSGGVWVCVSVWGAGCGTKL